ncbi:MAG: tRNA pseudouridine(38-40) synthase TruA [Bacteroidaceae bacterium]|nr:tRNA pseudouridine(38-40) synthase TruA [Bacteroidaceae bacterium]
MRYCIIFAYDGTAYHGWQLQPNAPTVQQALETALHTALRAEISVVGAGRTDTGVHARMMACHFDYEEELDCDHLTFKLNCLLPTDIAVSDVKPVAADWHARFSAIARTYHYYIITRKDAFLHPYALHLYWALDIEQMNEAARLLLTHDDFGCFCKSHSDNKTNICTVTEAQWTATEDGMLVFRITANRFLRNMVRAIVGTLIEVGKGKMSIDDFRQVLLSGKRTEAGESVPAKGLFLEAIIYP